MSENPIDEGYCYAHCNSNRKTCPRCGALNVRPSYSAGKAPHYAKMLCPNEDCQAFFGWIPAPETIKARRPASHRDLVKKSGVKHCQMCLRHETELTHPDHLQAHHVEEYCKGGAPDSENIWIICTACHSLINWARTYLNRGRAGDSLAG